MIALFSFNLFCFAMENLYCYFIFFLCCFLLFTLTKQFMSKKFWKLPPSPPVIPIIGHLHLIKNELYEDLASLASKYGPVFSLRFGWQSLVVVSSPSAIEECFAKNDVVLANRPPCMASDTLTYNYSAVTVAPYGQLWRIVRRLFVVESLSSNSLQKSSMVRGKEVQMILRSLFRVSKNGFQIVDLNHWISVLTLNIIMRMAAGKISFIGEEDAREEMGKKVIREFGDMYGPFIKFTMFDFFPVLRWIGYRRVEKGLISLHKKKDAFFQGLIDEVRKSGSGNEKKDYSLMESLLSHQEQDPDSLR